MKHAINNRQYLLYLNYHKLRKEVYIMPPLPRQRLYAIDDIYALPDGERAELIDGQIYNMAPLTRRHQEILSFLHAWIYNHVTKNNGECKVYPAPFAVFLFADDSKYLEPDISVICDKGKLDDYGCKGTPDWVIEIVSPASRRMDYYTELSLYRSANVREYWIVDPMKQAILVYDMEHDSAPAFYSFADRIKVNIYEDLWIDFPKLNL